MSKTKTIYLCPITNTQCDGCGGDSDCGLTRKSKEVPVRINPNLSYELNTAKSKRIYKLRQTLLTFSLSMLYAVIVYCLFAILELIVCLL